MSSPYIGETRVFAFDRVPAGWLPCEGQTLQIVDNVELFELLGTRFGGDGQNTFGLPNPAPLDAEGAPLRFYISLFGSYPQQG
jgi:microcystin-dependent protein